MPIVTLQSETDIAGWRRTARGLVQAGVKPEDIHWSVRGRTPDLFAERAASTVADQVSGAPRFSVPRGFIDLAENALCHSDPERFALLYRLLFRLRDRPRLLQIASDGDVMRATAWRKAVRRDIHKMHAFVRFRSVDMQDGFDGDGEDCETFVAWFEPDHHIVERAAPFFKKRFTNMRWSILTPKGSVHWDGQGEGQADRPTLRFTEAKSRADAPAEDAFDDWWRVYYRAIFNPARLKVSAMTAEMPKKYWRNLPEARLIPDLLAAAGARTDTMLDALPTDPPKRHRLRAERQDIEGASETVGSTNRPK